jgi:hypothetical protein
MPRKTKEERYGEWAGKVELVQGLMEEKVAQWDRHLRWYRMNVTEEESPKGDSVWINHYFAYSRIIIPSIYFRNPEPIVSPSGDTRMQFAEMWKDILEYQYKELNFKHEMRRVVFDVLFTGRGWVKLGYAPVTRTKNDEELIEELMEIASQEIFEEEERTEKKKHFEPNQLISDKHPFAIRVNPRFVLLDPLATSERDARWICHCILKPIEEVKDSNLYPGSLTSGITATHTWADEYLNQVYGYGAGARRLHPGEKVEEELVMLYEIWDIKNKQLIVLDSYNKDQGEKKFLREDDWPYPSIKGFPFESLAFNDDPDTPVAVPDVHTWENPSNAINLVNTIQYNHVKRHSSRKFVGRKGLFAGIESELTKFQDAHDAFFEVNGIPGQDGPLPVQHNPLPSELFQLRGELQNDLRLLSSVTEQREGSAEQEKTATEATYIEQNARVRDSDRISLTGDFIERTTRKLLALDRAYLTPAYAAFIGSPAKMVFWQNAAPEILKADVDVKIRVGSTAFVSKEVKVKQLLDFLNLTAPLGVVNIAEVVRRIAEWMDLDDLESLILPQAQQAMFGGPNQQQQMPPGGQGPQGPGPLQAMNLRAGQPTAGSQFSSTQNVRTRRTPNPTSEMGRKR